MPDYDPSQPRDRLGRWTEVADYEGQTGNPALPPEAPVTADDALHAYEITPDDAAFLRMMAGARFGPRVTVTLPSGKTVTGAEIARWLEAIQ